MIMAAAGCTAQKADPVVQPFGTYLGSDVQLLANDLANFQVRMEGQLGKTSLTDYADCVAAQYSADRGFSHLRVVRTNVYEEGGVQVADAIYTLSSTKPRGTRVINAAEQVATCGDKGIPTV